MILPFNASVDSVRASRLIGDLRLSVSEDHRSLVYVGAPLRNQVPIAYVKMPELSEKNIKISEFNEIDTIRIYENSSGVRYKRVHADKEFALPVAKADITDVVKLTPAGSPIPLFKRHIIGSFQAPPTLINSMGQNVDPMLYELVLAPEGATIFHNLTRESFGWPFQVAYTDANGNPITRILQSFPAFEEARIEDWSPQKRVYTTRRVGDHFLYEILFAGLGPFYVQISRSRQIKISGPRNVNPSAPWHVKVSDNTVHGIIDGDLKVYSIPEYHYQNFAPTEPIKFSGIEECSIYDSNRVFALNRNLLVDDLSPLDIIIFDKNFEIKDRKSTRLNSSHVSESRMPSSA